MIVEVLAVGTELLLGQIVNRNAADIGQRLAEAGLDHFRQVVVGDNLDRLAGAITEAAGRADGLIITGGLGPTPDDLTREAIALAAGVEMAFSDEQAERLRRRWEERGRVMPGSNLRQAEYPAGAELIENPKGTAPGLRMQVDGCWVFALPGVPGEMIPMLETQVMPFLAAMDGGGHGVLVSRVIRTWGESESRVAELVDDLFASADNPTMAFLASAGEIKVRLTARAADTAAAEALIAPVEKEVRSRLGRLVFGVDEQTIDSTLIEACRERGWRIATAESATGGLVAGALTAVPGASVVFAGSVVAYSRDAKERVLGVPAEVIDEHGLVDEKTALAMARGAIERFGAEVAIAVTGSAGPEPLEHPAGTMVFAVQTPEGARARTLRLPGDRERVRVYAATAALHLCRLAVAGDWWGER